MSLDHFAAAFPLPIDDDGAAYDTVDGEILQELHRRIDSLPELVLAACQRGIAEPDDDPAEARARLHDALVDTLTTEGTFMAYAVALRHRVWFVGGGLSAGEVPYNFENMAVIALSGITDEPVGLDPPEAARRAEARRARHLALGQRLAALGRQCLDEALRVGGLDDATVRRSLTLVDEALAARGDDLAALTGVVLRGGRADWLV
jgi:hypothetical protein